MVKSASSVATDRDGELPIRRRLVALSFLMLFVELAMIRFTGENVIYLSYFSNFVLLGSFLGVGLGFLTVERRVDLFRWLPVALLGLVAFVLAFPVEINRAGTELIFFGDLGPTGLPIWLTLPAIFLAAAGVMAMIAQAVARTFRLLPALVAYRADLIGSLLGIGAFAGLGWLKAAPVIWGLVAAVLILSLGTKPRGRSVWTACAGLVLLLLIQSLAPNVSWSPYYQITVHEISYGHWLAVNGIPHQGIAPAETRIREETIYAAPYRYLDDPGRVLIVGAGTGSDVAVALTMGADSVDAVEIDPRIYEIGVELNPDHPYSDSRVAVHVTDGRAFMERSLGQYDLILFALPDSLTLVSGQSSLRLESYLFTTEAIAEARRLLAPGGVFALYNYYREQWLVERLAATLQAVFNAEPCVETRGSVGRLAMLVVGGEETTAECFGRVLDTVNAPLPVSDDYPFLYLRERSIPLLYLGALGLIVLTSLLATRWAAGKLTAMRPYGDLFLMGAAFLLLETKNVVQFALLFGTTWVVNALVFAGVLLAVLAATEVVRRVDLPKPAILYLVLLASLAVAWAVPQHWLLNLSVGVRLVLATALAFAPIFLANLIFAGRLKESASSTTAFGANLLGAMFGGVLEYGALVIGYRGLLIVVALIYGAAFWSRPAERSELVPTSGF